MKQEFLELIPTNEALEPRFNFIDDEALRSNVVIYFRYIIFLLRLSEDEGAESLVYSLFKDIIIYTASIIESLLEHTVNREVSLGRIDRSMLGKGEKVAVLSTIQHSCEELNGSSSVLQVVKKTTYFKHGTSDRFDFKDFTHAAKSAGILSPSEYRSAEDLRKKRNKIHISALTNSSDDLFTKADVEKVFKSANDIIRKIELLYQ